MAYLSPFLDRISSWKSLLILFAVYAMFPVVFFKHAGERISALAGTKTGIIDLTFGFNPQKTLNLVEQYGHAGRAYYAMVEMTLDIAYPIVYSLLFSVILTLIYRKLLRGQVQYLNRIPFITAILDIFENVCIISLLQYHPDQSMFMAILCEFFKLAKWLSLGLVFFLIIVGLIRLAKSK